MSILMFHDIRDEINFFKKRYELPYFLSVDEFKSLSKKFNSTFSMNDTFELSKFNSKNHLYTFDDGLKDHLYVARYLKKLNIKAVFFIPSKIFSGNFIIESHKIQFLLSSIDNKILKKEIQFHVLENKKADISFFEKSKWKNNIWSPEMVFCTRFFREFDDSIFRKKLLNHLFHKYVKIPAETIVENFYLNIEDLTEIINLGHIIGGHGHESLNLFHEKKDIISSEILNSKYFFKTLGIDLKLFAYPNGGFNEFSVNLLINNGFDFGFTTHLKDDLIKSNDFKINRIDATKFL